MAGGQNFPLEKFLGKEMFREELKHINLTYRSYVFRLNELNMKEMGQYYYQIDPPKTNIGGVISPMEGGLVMVTLIEHEEEFSECPTFHDFLKKAEHMKSPEFLRILKDAKPFSGPHSFRKPTIYKRTLNLKKMPPKVIVIGDALLSLNPVFGQGMSVSLNQVEILKGMLNSNTFSEASFQRCCKRDSLLPYYLSLFGSQDKGLGKTALRIYMKACQKSRLLHHLFLRQLHSMKLFPGLSL